MKQGLWAWIRAGRGLIGLLCLLLPVCTGCGTSSEVLAGGETITPEQLQEISEAIFSVSDEPKSTTNAETDDLLADWEGEVYWLASGGVVHTDRDCSYIRGKDGVRSGSVQDATSAGKTNLCKSCRKKLEQAASAEPDTSDAETASQTSADTPETAVVTIDADTATEPSAIDDSLAAWDSEVYWLSGGSVVHTDRDCSYIRGKDGVKSGSVQDAASAGKTNLCKSCRKKLEQTSDRSETTTESEGATP